QSGIVTRREFLFYSGFAAPLIAKQGGDSGAALLDPAKLRKFVDRLSIPPTVRSASIGRIRMTLQRRSLITASACDKWKAKFIAICHLRAFGDLNRRHPGPPLRLAAANRCWLNGRMICRKNIFCRSTTRFTARDVMFPLSAP